MRGLVNHEKRNLLAITLVYTIVICFILQYVIANDISGTADQINNFYGGTYNNYGNLFLGTLDQYYEMFIIVLMIPVSFVAVDRKSTRLNSSHPSSSRMPSSA